MPTIEFNQNKLECQVGESLIETCVELGLSFSCREGNCGVCLVRVISGEKFLAPMSENELDFGLEEGERLMCQCQFKEDGHLLIKE